MFSMGNEIKLKSAVAAQLCGVSAADVVGSNIDRAGFEALSFALNVGAEGDTPSGSVKIECFLEHADDDGSGAPGAYAAVAATDVVIPVQSAAVAWATGGVLLVVDAASEAPSVHMVDYVGGKQWTRWTVNATGSTNGWPVAIDALLMKPHLAPVS